MTRAYIGIWDGILNQSYQDLINRVTKRLADYRRDWEHVGARTQNISVNIQVYRDLSFDSSMGVNRFRGHWGSGWIEPGADLRDTAQDLVDSCLESMTHYDEVMS